MLRTVQEVAGLRPLNRRVALACSIASLPTDSTRHSLNSLPEGYRALVIGSSGTLGTAFVQLLQNDSRCETVRELHRHSLPALDFNLERSIADCTAKLALEDRFHLIILATGVLHSSQFGPEKKWSDLNLATMEAVFRVNALGPAALLSGLLDRLDRQRGLMMILSAKVGSIEDNRLGGWYSYRASKAALNMFIKTASIELKRKQAQSVLVAMHPGTVSSPLSKPFGGDDLGRPARVAAGEMLAVIDLLRPIDSGSFVSYKGERLPW